MKELDPTESHCTQNNTDEIVRTDKIVVLTTQIIHFGGTMKYYKVCNTSFLGKKKSLVIMLFLKEEVFIAGKEKS